MDKCEKREMIDYMMAFALISSLYKKGQIPEEMFKKIKKKCEKELKKYPNHVNILI